VCAWRYIITSTALITTKHSEQTGSAPPGRNQIRSRDEKISVCSRIHAACPQAREYESK